MPLAKGVSKKLALKKESTWGTLAGPTGAKYLRRVTSNFNLAKETYESNEIRTDYQLADFRHGVRSAAGSLNGELSPGSYSDFMGSIVAKDFVTGITTSSASVTIAASGSFFTITRATGSYLTDLLYVGSIVRLVGAGLNAANVGNNLLVVALTATIMTVKVLSSVPLVPEGPIATVTAVVTGKQTYAPLTAHTDDSYTVEEWYSDIAQSEVYTGMKVGTMNVQLPSTGLVTVDFSLMGKDLAQTGTSAYFTTPTAAGSTATLASVSGALVVNGVAVALITSLDFTVERAMENATVVGSNSIADMFTGRIKVNGNISTYFQDATFRDYFKDEAVVSIVVAVTAGQGKTDDAISFTLPKVKVGSFDKADSENGIVASQSFQALLNSVVTGGLPTTTIMIQDTSI